MRTNAIKTHVVFFYTRERHYTCSTSLSSGLNRIKVVNNVTVCLTTYQRVLDLACRAMDQTAAVPVRELTIRLTPTARSCRVWQMHAS